MRLASLDIGTNTVLLLVAECEDHHIQIERDDHAIGRLGEGVDKTGNISDAALNRFLDILKRHVSTIKESGAEGHVVAVATSAMRDAANRETIVQRTLDETGIHIQILSGEAEARATYAGALLGLTLSADNIAAVDIGGGSTEVSVGAGGKFSTGVSLDIGAVRITERFFATSPITREAAAEAAGFIREMLQKNLPTPGNPDLLVAVAGTPTTLAAMHQGLSTFDTSKVQGYQLSRRALQQLLEIQLSVDTQTLLARFPSINKARADILPAGSLILDLVMEHLGMDRVTVSTRGLRYGVLLREAERLFGPGEFSITE